MSPASNQSQQVNSLARPQYSVIYVEGTLHAEVAARWEDDDTPDPEFETNSYKASAELVVDENGTFHPEHPETIVYIMMNDGQYSQSIRPRVPYDFHFQSEDKGYLAFDGEMLETESGEEFRRGYEFRWERIWTAADGTEVRSIPPLPTGTSQAVQNPEVLNPDELCSESSDGSAQEEAEGI